MARSRKSSRRFLGRSWRRTQRLTAALVLLGCLGVGTIFVLTALRENIVFFLVPSDIEERLADGSWEGGHVRLGGLVLEGSVAHDKDSGEVRFVVTDGAAQVAVHYRGLVPDLFREGQGVVATGKLQALRVPISKSDGETPASLPLLKAEQILAKHDEYYMPRGLEKALKKRDLWREQP